MEWEIRGYCHHTAGAPAGIGELFFVDVNEMVDTMSDAWGTVCVETTLSRKEYNTITGVFIETYTGHPECGYHYIANAAAVEATFDPVQ
jgi:hypothetical protein